MALQDLPDCEKADGLDLCDIEHFETATKLTKEFVKHLRELKRDTIEA